METVVILSTIISLSLGNFILYLLYKSKAHIAQVWRDEYEKTMNVLFSQRRVNVSALSHFCKKTTIRIDATGELIDEYNSVVDGSIISRETFIEGDFIVIVEAGKKKMVSIHKRGSQTMLEETISNMISAIAQSISKEKWQN